MAASAAGRTNSDRAAASPCRAKENQARAPKKARRGSGRIGKKPGEKGGDIDRHRETSKANA
jgi:hypothetical protein